MLNSNFVPYNFKHGLLENMENDEFPTKLYSWDRESLKLENEGTHLGYVFEGKALLNFKGNSYWLPAGSFFSVPGDCEIMAGLEQSRGIIITRLGYWGMFNLGMTEATGRLKYIDGCSDSILIHPVKKGDCCLNALYFPPNINQTQHTHPSMRVGIVASGEGCCITPEQIIPLHPGRIFIIPADKLHSFKTENQSMTVIAYHPDSDFGAEDENHPMINRTLVDGVSASNLDTIRTKELINA